MSAPKFDRGDVVYALCPQPDSNATTKCRCLIVGDPFANSHGDYILIQITSQPYFGKSDFTLAKADPEFPATGLTESSTFRCHKIFVLTEFMVQTKAGSVGPVIRWLRSTSS